LGDHQGNLVEQSVDTIFRMSPTCEILYVSPAVKRQLGFEPQELVGKIIFDLIHELDRLIARAAAAKSAELGVDNSPGTQRWMHKDMYEELRARGQTFEVLTGGDFAANHADGQKMILAG
jgi:PAS domain S-box-containing protein